MCPHSIQIIHTHPPPRAHLKRKDPTLTSLPIPLIRAGRAVIIKERIQPRAVDEDIGRVEDTETPSLARRNRNIPVPHRSIRHKYGIREHGIIRKRQRRRGVGLVVSGLCLDLSREDVGGVGELVLVFDVVFDCGAGEPGIAGAGFDEEAAAGVDGYLGLGGGFNVVAGWC